MYRALRVVLSVATVVNGFRVARKNKVSSDSVQVRAEAEVGALAEVDQLFTFGCPKVSTPALRNPRTSDGCFRGSRVVNEQKILLLNNVDIFVGILNPTLYKHVYMPAVYLNNKGGVTEYSCKEAQNAPIWDTWNILLHPWWTYISRASEVPYLYDAAAVSLEHSYYRNTKWAAGNVSAMGWGMVAATQVNNDKAYLVQNPRTKRCLLSFSGTDDVENIVDDLKVIRVSFCGLEQKVHLGFKEALNKIVNSSRFKKEVNDNLGHCSAVDVVGHSLGGALAALFTACSGNYLQSWQEGYDEHKHMVWLKKETKVLPYL